MNKHFQYLKYLLCHKYFVFVAGRKKMKFKSSLWRLIIHDWSKFLPSEWFAYVEFFYGGKKEEALCNFNEAWNHHQKRNKHHWQYWVLVPDAGIGYYKPLEMPLKYVKEMVADWMGAGRAITGKWEVEEWYNKNKARIYLHENTRNVVEQLILNNGAGGSSPLRLKVGPHTPERPTRSKIEGELGNNWGDI